MDPQTHVITQLPLTPQASGDQVLMLCYEPDSGCGTFSYGDRPLSLACTYQETMVSNTHPTGLTQTRTSPPALRVNCARWVNDFGNWPIDEDKKYAGQAIQDVATETERAARYFSGFAFDLALRVWKATWEKRDHQQVFNSTFDDAITVELVLNLIEETGIYRESRCMDTAT